VSEGGRERETTSPRHIQYPWDGSCKGIMLMKTHIHPTFPQFIRPPPLCGVTWLCLSHSLTSLSPCGIPPPPLPPSWGLHLHATARQSRIAPWCCLLRGAVRVRSSLSLSLSFSVSLPLSLLSGCRVGGERRACCPGQRTQLVRPGPCCCFVRTM